jgi:folate-binding protein YgfZ
MIAAVTIHHAVLPSRGALAITGPDTQTFLQGQTTCDLRELAPERALAGAYCTPQGRVVADFRILGYAEESWLLQMDAGICDHAAAVFGKYIVFSKAEISNASALWTQFAAWGEGAAQALGAPGDEQHQVWQALDATWVQTDATGARVEGCVPTERAAALATALAAQYAEGTESDWKLAEIEAGEAHVCAPTIEMFLPQMLDYDHSGRVSFTKGCYTGQEVVARLHYRGQVKRILHRGETRCQEVQAGAPLFVGDQEQSVGNVVNTAPSGRGTALLAVLAREVDLADLRLGEPSGEGLSLQPVNAADD